MASSSYKIENVRETLTGCLEYFYSEVEELASECREVIDSAPEGLQSTDRITTFESTADVLENVTASQIELSDEVKALFTEPLAIAVMRNRRKGRGPSRSSRCSNACAYGEAAANALEAWCDEHADKSDTVIGTTKITTDLVEEVKNMVNELRDQVDEAQGTEFPSMFG